MVLFSRVIKVAFGAGVIGGGYAYYNNSRLCGTGFSRFFVINSRSENLKPITKWDTNWDHCEPTSVVKPSNNTPEGDERYKAELDRPQPTALRHVILVRHGQTNLIGSKDEERILTDLGRAQASLTGKRLAELGIKYDVLVRSTMTRAQETARLIAEHLPKDVVVHDCQLLEEGNPVLPEPLIGDWWPQPQVFYEDGMRLEAAFRKYFYRAEPSQKEDTYTLLVCHANVIRFLVCKALQLPTEAWFRFTLNHGSITWLTILPNGHVALRGFGDTGFMEPALITFKNIVPNMTV